MDAPHSLHIPSLPPIFNRVAQAFAQIEPVNKLALLFILVGWFFTNTLVVSLGSLRHGVRFFDMAAVIADPARLFFGVNPSFERVLFGLICLGCVGVPLMAHFMKQRIAWLAYLA